MSDEEIPDTVPAPPTVPEPAVKPESSIAYPDLTFVKGGTATLKSERYFEEQYQDAERRRNVRDRERELSETPIERGGAVMYTNQLTDHPEIPKAYVHLKYVSSSGVDMGYECLGDLIVGEDQNFPTKLTLIIVCPRCAQGQKHLQDCQLRIAQAKKHFTLKPGVGPSEFTFEGELFKSAGTITECERFRCPDCGWSASITNNCIRPD